MRVTVGPILLGYMCVRLDAPSNAAARGQTVLARYAEREGFALGTVFVERDVNRPLSALAALIETAKREDITVVAVPTPTDLGLLPRVQWLTCRMLQREAGIRVLVVDPARA
jgi:hypothetical protein